MHVGISTCTVFGETNRAEVAPKICFVNEYKKRLKG
jgi:hypothetical protein